MSEPSAFPIAPLLPEVRATLATSSRLVLEAPPGAGKTTQVPLALLNEPWLAGRRIIVLEPRRLAARAAATFMAEALGEPVGATVGYRVRFETRTCADTRIEVVTEGILTRLLQDDPELTGIGAILFDEFHERALAADLGLALALDVQATLRPDLRLVLMSATLEGERLSRWFAAPRLSSAGRAFPVHIVHPPARTQEPLEQQLVRVVRQALAEHPGDVLVFLPGRREIARVRALLERALAASAAAVECVALHGDLSLAEQALALAPAAPGMRRVVLSTNLAESSLTLPGIRVVVDSGLARELRFDPGSGFSRLETVTISQAAADQRAGRAGRIAPGVAYRLWPQSRRLEAARMPQMLQAELSGLALELAAWGVTGAVDGLRWLDPPPPGALAQARELLRTLGALDLDGRITALGRRMLELGAPPRLAAAVLAAPPERHALVADLLAVLEARSPLRGEAAGSDDLRLRLTALHAWRDRGGAGMPVPADGAALAAIEQAAKGWRRRLGARGAASGIPDSHALGELLAPAFPDRIARRDDHDPRRYTLANGRGARLAERSALAGEAWLVVTELKPAPGDSLILQAVPLDPQVLEERHAGRFTTVRTARWHAERATVEAFEERRFGAIVLARRNVPVAADDARAALLDAVRERGLELLPWDEAAMRLRRRVAALRAWMPELGLPQMSDAALLDGLETWLAPRLAGHTRLGTLAGADLLQALDALLDPQQRRALGTHAPEAIRVPSGQTRRLDYGERADEEGPVLAVKLQELFGLTATPRVAAGRIPVTLHLLSPAGRPIQVTRDLEGFWRRTYPEVKKELKGRYPRHPWPDDPLTAAPTHRAKPRGA